MSSIVQSRQLFALVDCNNFYASCERVFQPKLKKRPIVVLSNNDGCIVARSNEAKALGIPMGAPLFQYRELIERQGVHICSSNFALYGDMSQRVMQSLEEFSPNVEIYSIDEAFLDFDFPDPLQQGRDLRKAVNQWTGIPVSVGIAPTKTLAKVANHIAKKDPAKKGVYSFEEKCAEEVLSHFPISDIWGIGRRYTEMLCRYGIKTAWDFRSSSDEWIRKKMGVVGLRIAMELRGVSCIPFDEAPSAKQSITCSRTFGRPVTEIEELAEAVASYAAKAAEKMRKEKRLASSLFLFLLFHPFRSGSNSLKITFPEPTAYTPEIVYYAKLALSQLYREAYVYRKAGVLLEGLVDEETFQRDLFENKGPLHDEQMKRMELLDKMNKKFGKKTLHFAAEGVKKEWSMKREMRSPRYTTCWEEIPVIKSP